MREARPQRRRTAIPRAPCAGAAVALVALVIAGCHHPPLPTTIVVGPRRELLVRANLNDVPVLLQLDTGSSTTLLTPAACQRIGAGRRPRSIAPPSGHGAGGDIRELAWVILRKIQLADQVLRAEPAVMADINAGAMIDGLLGMDLLGRYILDVDLQARRFVLRHPSDLGFQSEDLVAADYDALPGGQIALEIMIGGRPVTAVLDLGANRTFANTRAGVTPDDDTVISAVISSDGHRLRFLAASDVPLAVGTLVLHARSVWISDLPIFHRFGLADRPAVLLGTDVLAGRRVVIDPFERRVYLSRLGAPPAGSPMAPDPHDDHQNARAGSRRRAVRTRKPARARQ